MPGENNSRHSIEMKIHILDHGLVAKSGHHFDYCHSIAQHLVEKGATVTVCAFQGAQPEVGEAFRALGCVFSLGFSRSAFAPTGFGTHAQQALEAIVHQAAAEMEAITGADLWVFPTLTADHLLAFAKTRNTPAMVGLAHTEPNRQHALGGRAWALGCENILQRGLKVRIGAVDPLVRDYLQTYSAGLPIWDMPIPVHGARRTGYPERPRTIGFFGHQRLERGIALIPELARQLLGQGYEVVLQDTRQQFQAQGMISRLHLRGFASDLCAEMTTCDLVVCPMERRNYAHRLSGIAYSAVASGTPVVLPAGTLSAIRAQALGSSCAYVEHTVESILAAVEKLASDYPAHARAADRGATLFRQRHGVEKFVQMLLDEVGRV
jgi:hypothetical protein